MTPAATLMRYFRKVRGFQQKKCSILLGYRYQGFVSDIETGRRNVGWVKFKSKLISGYQLTNSEIDELNEAIKFSNHIIELPLKMPESRFRLAHYFYKRLENLSQREINQIMFALASTELSMNESPFNRNSRNAILALASKKRANGN